MLLPLLQIILSFIILSSKPLPTVIHNDQNKQISWMLIRLMQIFSAISDFTYNQEKFNIFMERLTNSYQLIFEKLQLKTESNVYPIERLNQVPVLSTPLIGQKHRRRQLSHVSSTQSVYQKIPSFTGRKINPLFAKQHSGIQTQLNDSVDEQFLQISKTLKEIDRCSVETKLIGKRQYSKSQNRIMTQDESVHMPSQLKTTIAQPRNLRDLQIRIRTNSSAKFSSLPKRKGDYQTPPVKQRSRKSSIQYMNIYESISSSTSIRIPQSPQKEVTEIESMKRIPQKKYYRKSIFLEKRNDIKNLMFS